MKILPVSDPSFQNYGQVLTGYDLKELLETLDRVTPCPDGVEYVPEQAELQALAVEKDLRNNAYGGMPIQIGWCNGPDPIPVHRRYGEQGRGGSAGLRR